MSLFDSASLVVTPNGYKEDKLYSIKPTDGSGDLSVTRATTATRVNSTGLIEPSPYNLITYSEQFDNAAWGGFRSVITANNTTAPDGNTTADKLAQQSGVTDAGGVIQNVTLSIGTSYTYSYYVKAGGYNWTYLRVDDGANNYFVWFNLSTGVVGSIIGSATAYITNSGNGWYRCNLTFTSTGTSGRAFGYIANSNGTDQVPSSDGVKGIYIWGAQLEAGTSAKEYFPTTDRLNVPRLDYTGSTCPSILVEPQRTNNFNYSEQFDNAYWAKSLAVVTANNTTAPDGNSTADKVEFNSGFINGTATVAANQTYTISFFAKKGTSDILYISEAFYFGTYVAFDLNTGTITSGTGKIENYGNGWYRCSMQITYGVGQTIASWVIRNYQSGYIYIWGAQIESGSYATSYIPTVASSVTRNADVISKTGISSLIGQTEGTIYFEYLNKNGLGTIPFKLTGNNGKLVWVRGTGTMFFGDGTSLLFNNYGTPTANQLYKIAFVYGQNDFRLYVNGVQISAVTSGTFTGTFDDIQIPALPNEYPFGQQVFIKTAALWKSKLSNSELATLTTI
jgi:hypothetical protein